MNDNEFLTVRQVSKLLQIHWQTVLNYIKSKKLMAIRLGKGYRISRDDLDKFIKNNQVKK